MIITLLQEKNREWNFDEDDSLRLRMINWVKFDIYWNLNCKKMFQIKLKFDCKKIKQEVLPGTVSVSFQQGERNAAF